jgi:osmoprotectant transport system permease protein
MSALSTVPVSFLGDFGGAIDFIFNERGSVGDAGILVGGPSQIWDLLSSQLAISLVALLLATLIALPIGLYLGHRGTGEFLAVAVGNAGRAVPELALIAMMIAFVGTGAVNVTIAVTVLGIPPILTNAFVGVRQVDSGTVEAARGIGMTELEIIRKVEAPMAVTSIFTGIRTSTIGIVATATIAPLAGVATLGEFILGENVYGSDGVLAGAILVAVLALVLEFSLAALQRRMTSKGLKLRPA